MFGNKCERCGQKFVRLIELKSYGNYLMCPNLYNSLLANFKRDDHRIYCCGCDEEKPKARKPKPNSCVYCNDRLLKLALMKPFTLYHVCPEVLGFFLYAYETERKALETKIHCKTKVKVDAKVKNYATVTIPRGVSNYPLSKVQFANNTDSTISNLRIRVDAPKGWIILVSPKVISVLPAGGSCDFEIRLSIPETIELGEYFVRYYPHAERLGETELAPNKVLKVDDFGSPSIVKVVVV